MVAVMKADTKPDDRSELPSLMEPLLIGDGSRHRPYLTDLAFDLTQKSAGFRRSLPASLLTSLADLVRSMNCYYSRSGWVEASPVSHRPCLRSHTEISGISAQPASEPAYVARRSRPLDELLLLQIGMGRGIARISPTLPSISHRNQRDFGAACQRACLRRSPISSAR